MSDENELITVYAGNTIETHLIEGLLKDAKIATFLKDEILGELAPFYAAAGGAGAIKVVVAKRDFEKAKTIIQEFIDKRI